MTLVIRDARVVTAPGAGALRGRAMDGLTVIERGDVVVSSQRVESVHDHASGGAAPRFGDADEIDAGGRVLMAGFVDAHTHLCWAGDRLDEWERKRAGAASRAVSARIFRVRWASMVNSFSCFGGRPRTEAAPSSY